jgi:Rv0078B-related antitoxin
VTRSNRAVDARRIERLDPEVARILRGKSGMERLRLAHDAWELAHERLTAFLASRHPGWTPEQIRREVATRLSR